MGLSLEEKEKRKIERKIVKWNSCHKIIEGIDHKLCTTCNVWHPSNTDYFYPNRSNSIDGLHPYCIECSKVKADDWQRRPENYDKVMNNVRNQNAKEKNKETKRKFSKKQRDSGYTKEYYYNNPERFRCYGQDRSKKKHDISIKEWDACRLYFNYRCAYCEVSYEEHYKINNQDFHQEHVDDDGANDLSNCIPSCRNCNSQKWIYDFGEWYNKRNPNYTLERHQKILKWLNEDYKKYIVNKKQYKKTR